MSLKVPFGLNIEKETINNSAYRNVIWTGENMQIVLMSLKAKEEIGVEKHATHDQFFRVEAGQMKAVIGKGVNNNKEFEAYHLKAGDAIVVPQKHYHNIINHGTEDLKLYTIYAPPQHPFNRYEPTKP